jgi:hypothetical protein
MRKQYLVPEVRPLTSIAVSFAAGCGLMSAQPLRICFWISQPVICRVISQVSSPVDESVVALVGAFQVSAIDVSPVAFAFLLTGLQGASGGGDPSAAAACSEAASSAPGTSTHAGMLKSDSFVPAVAEIR